MTLITAIVAIAAVLSRKKRKTAAVIHSAYTKGAYPPPAQSPKPTVQGVYCTQGGAPLASDTMFCTKCGKRMGI